MADEAIKTTEFEGDLAIERNVTSGGGVTARDDSLFSKDLTVEGWLNAKNVKPIENLTVNNDLNVSGTSNLKYLVTTALAKLASLEVEGNADFKGTSNFEGTATFKKLVATVLAKLASLEVEGTASFNGDAVFNGSTVFIGQTNIGGGSSGGGSSSGDTSSLTSLVVSGATVLNTLVTQGLATLAKLIVNGDAQVVGETTLSTLITSGLATLASLQVKGNSSLSTLITSGLATLASLKVEGGTTLGQLTVTDDATFENLLVNGWSKFAQYLQSVGYDEDILTGHGWKITSNGDILADSLTLRKFLEVPELRYNRAEVILGDEWQAPGGGIIDSVTPDTTTDADGNTVNASTGTATLHLEDGELGAIAVGDICMGYWHFLGSSASNAAADSDDSRGNMTHAGFTTIYFRITSVSGDDNSTFTYALRSSSDNWTANNAHPQPAMHFVAYGSFSDTTRQKSAIRTKTYTRYLAGVNTWEFSAANIKMQLGDLSNLSVHGFDSMAGYSAYLSNIYMTGRIQQIDNLEELIGDVTPQPNLLNGTGLVKNVGNTSGYDRTLILADYGSIINDGMGKFGQAYYKASQLSLNVANVLYYVDASQAIDIRQIRPSTQYTLSFWIKGTGQADNIAELLFWSDDYSAFLTTIDASSEAFGDGGLMDMQTSTAWEQHYITFTTTDAFPDDSTNPTIIACYALSADACICCIKLEEGAKATPWCLSEGDKIGNDGEAGADGQDAINVVILTDKGNIIKNGQGTVTLTAVVYKGAERMENLTDNLFSWERTSDDTTSDTAWNGRHEGVGPTITLTQEDIWQRAQFECIVNLTI